MDIVDCQVNIGKTPFGPDSDMQTYHEAAIRTGIKKAILIPTLTHIFDYGEFVEESCLWRKEEGEIIYELRRTTPDGKTTIETNPSNPYERANNHIRDIGTRLTEEGEVSYYFAPKIHPLLDSPEAIERQAKQKRTVALKINGLATHIRPQDVPEHVFSIANKYDLPLFVHTDFLNEAYADQHLTPDLAEIIRENTANNWLDMAEKHHLQKMYLAHLARLDPSAIERVNNSDKYILGTGPDALLQEEPARLHHAVSDVFMEALKLTDPEKLAYNSDFAWNAPSREQWGTYDWSGPEKIIANCDPETAKKILSSNAEDFFRLK